MKKPIIINYKKTASLVDGTIEYFGLVITAVQQMAEAYRAKGVPATVYNVNMVLRILLPVWYDAPLLLKQRITLNRVINNICDQMADDTLANSLKNNRSEMLRSFRTLAEIGINWQDLPETTGEERVTKAIYKEFVLDSGSCVEAFWAEVRKWENPQMFRRCLEERTMRVSNKAIGVPRAVYFQGFYYISALQSRLIEAFCGLDIPVYYLNGYDDDHAEAYRIWAENPRFKGLKTRFCGDENEIEKFYIDQAPIYKFRDTFSMVSYLGKEDFNSLRLYAPMSDDIKDITDTFFVDRDEKSHILAYPAGKYLFSLYSMWDDTSGTINIEPEKIKECLATGWAGRRYSDSSRIFQIYTKVADYFRDCRQPAEWEERISRLIAVVENIVPMFRPKVEADEEIRWHTVLSDPLHSLSCLNCSREDVQLFAEGVRQVISDCKLLFDGTGPIDISQHFYKIKKMLAEKTDGCILRQEERKIVDVLNRRLSMTPEIITDCDVGHLSDVMRFFLGGEIDEIIEDAEKISSATDIIRGISDIEAASILYVDKKIMFCCCDAITMPGGKKKFTWPLNKEMIQSLPVSGETKKRCEDYLYFIESTRLSNRYLFHLIKKLDNTEISWVEKQHDKDVNPSVYLLPYMDRVIEKSSLLLDNTSETMWQKGPWNIGLSDEVPMPELAESTLERLLCPAGNWRVIYSLLLNQWPYYKSEFHLQFVMSGIIRVIADTMGISVTEAGNHVFELYPSMNKAERQECIEFAEKISADHAERIVYGSKTYSDRRLYTEYIPANQLNDISSRPATEQNEEDDEEDYKYCHFCPHGDCCMAKGGRYK